MDVSELKEVGSDLVKQVFDWATYVQPGAVKTHVDRLREKKPDASPRELAETIVRRTKLKTTAVGAGTGLPANPWTSGGAGILDAGAVLRMHSFMVAQIGECYDPDFLDDPDAQAELLVPLFGANAASQAVREGAVLGGMGVTRQAIKKLITGDRLKRFRRIMLKYFGKIAGQKTVITKTFPVIGALIGGGWNFAETSVVGNRAIKWFEGEALPVEDEDEAPTTAPEGGVS